MWRAVAATMIFLQTAESGNWKTGCFLEKHCAQLPTLTSMWKLIEKGASDGEPVQVRECFERVPLTVVGDSRPRQLRHIINTLTL